MMQKMAHLSRLIFVLLLLIGILTFQYCTNDDVPKVDCDRSLIPNTYAKQQLLPILEQDTLTFQIDKSESKEKVTFVKSEMKIDTLHFLNDDVEFTEPCINQKTLHMVRIYALYKNLENSDSIHISIFNDGQAQRFVVELKNYTLYHGSLYCFLCPEQTTQKFISNDTFDQVHKLDDGLVNKKFVTDPYQYFIKDGRLKILTLPKDEAQGFFDLQAGLLSFVLNKGEIDQETWTRILK